MELTQLLERMYGNKLRYLETKDIVFPNTLHQVASFVMENRPLEKRAVLYSVNSGLIVIQHNKYYVSDFIDLNKYFKHAMVIDGADEC